MAPPTETGSQKKFTLKSKLQQIREKMKADMLEKMQKAQEKKGSVSSTKEKEEPAHAKEVKATANTENQREKRIPLSVSVRRSMTRETGMPKLRSESVQTYPRVQKRDRCSNCCGGVPGKGPASSSAGCGGKCCCIKARRMKGGGSKAIQETDIGTRTANERITALTNILRKISFSADYPLPGSGDFVNAHIPFLLENRSKIFQLLRRPRTWRRGNYSGRSDQKDFEEHSGLGGGRVEAQGTWRQSFPLLDHRLKLVPRPVTTYHEVLMAPMSLGKTGPQSFELASQQRMRGGCNGGHSPARPCCRSISSTSTWNLPSPAGFSDRNIARSDYRVNVQADRFQCLASNPMRGRYECCDDVDSQEKDPWAANVIPVRIRGGCGGSCGQNLQANPCGMPRYDQQRSIACSTTSCAPPSCSSGHCGSSAHRDQPCYQDFQDNTKGCCPCGACGGPACGTNPRRAENSNSSGCCANAPKKKQPCKCKCQGCSGIRPVGGCGGQTCGRIYSCAGSGGGSCCFPRNTRRRSGSECCGGGSPECGGCC